MKHCIKLHKVKKRWVTVGATVLTLLTAGIAQADEQANTVTTEDSVEQVINQADGKNSSVDNVADTNTEGTVTVNDTTADTATVETSQTQDGLVTTDDQTYYYHNGQQVKGDFASPNDQDWYYFDETGQAVTGWQTIYGKTHVFDQDGKQIKGSFQSPDNENWYYLDKDHGNPVTGRQVIDGKTYYFYPNGKQAKGDFVTETIDGKVGRYFYDADTGELVTNSYDVYSPYEYTFDENGGLISKRQTGPNQSAYFDENGQQVQPMPYNIETSDYAYRFGSSGKSPYKAKNILDNGVYYGLDGKRVRNAFAYLTKATTEYSKNISYWGSPLTRPEGWYYFDQDGKLVTGLQTIDGKLHYFNEDGSQVKGGFASPNGRDWYYLDKDNGQAVTGWQTIDGNTYYFHENGVQAKDGFASPNGRDWYYLDKDSGQTVAGWQTIAGKTYYFDENGVQVKGGRHYIKDAYYAFDKDNGELLTDQDVTIDGVTYRANAYGRLTHKSYDSILDTEQPANTLSGGHYEERSFFNELYFGNSIFWVYIKDNGELATGLQVIDGQTVYFYDNGAQVKGHFARIDGNTYYFDENSGAMIKDTTIPITIANSRLYFGYSPMYSGWIHLGANGAADSGIFYLASGGQYTFKTADGKGDWYNNEGHIVY